MSPKLLAPAFLSSSPCYQGLLIPAWLGQEGQLLLHHLVERNGATRQAWTPPTWLGSAASLTSRSCLSASRFSTWTPSPAETRLLNCRTSLMRATLISSSSLRLGLRLWVTRSNCKSWSPPGFVIHSCPRKGRPAGGIAVLYRDTLHNCVTISSKEHGAESFESCETQVNYIDQSLTVLCLYRPLPSKKNQLKTTQFMTEFPELLEDLATRCLKLVVIGDININFDSNSDPNMKSLKSLFPTLHLVQHISVPTHRRGHILDWLIASEDISIQDIEVVDKLLSDHFVMSFSFNLRKPARATRNVSSRDIRRINLNAFKADVGALQLDSSDLLHSYNSGLREVLDKHAPLRHCRITDHPSAPWLTVQIKEAKEQRRCAERRWRKSGLTVHRQLNLHPPLREGEETSCRQRRTTCATRSRAVFLAKISSTSQISCRARRRTAPSQAPSPLSISQIRLEISSRLRSRDWGMSLMLHLDSLTSRSSVVPRLKPSPLWQSSKWRTSSLKPQRSHAHLILSQHT